MLSRIGTIAAKDQPKYTEIVQKVEKAEEYAMSRIITEIKKDSPQETNPEESRRDYNTIVRLMEEAKEMKEVMMSQSQAIKDIKHELHMLKISSG